MKFSYLFLTLFLSLSLLGVSLSFAEGGGGIECPETSGAFTFVSGSAVYQTNSFEDGEIGVLYCEYETESEEEMEPFGEVIAIFHVSGELSQELVDEYGCGAVLGKQYSSTYVVSETHFSSVAFSVDSLAVAAGNIMSQIENQNLATTCIASENQGSTADIVTEVIKEHEVIEDKTEEITKEETAEFISATTNTPETPSPETPSPETPSPETPSPESIIEIPSWIKNDAELWADGQIDDEEFVQGIQYLINNEIMNIPQTESGESSGNKIPDWIKNSAEWWADGQIDDEEFVDGIQYLVLNGIISV